MILPEDVFIKRGLLMMGLVLQILSILGTIGICSITIYLYIIYYLKFKHKVLKFKKYINELYLLLSFINICTTLVVNLKSSLFVDILYLLIYEFLILVLYMIYKIVYELLYRKPLAKTSKMKLLKIFIIITGINILGNLHYYITNYMFNPVNMFFRVVSFVFVVVLALKILFIIHHLNKNINRYIREPIIKKILSIYIFSINIFVIVILLITSFIFTMIYLVLNGTFDIQLYKEILAIIQCIAFVGIIMTYVINLYPNFLFVSINKEHNAIWNMDQKFQEASDKFYEFLGELN
ncbi:MAG: hypothetical protein ACTSXF_11185 [Promethearchaeota archaeon]